MPLRQFLDFLDRIHSFFTVQHRFGTLPLQTSFDNHVDERLAIADVSALGEVCSEQCLHDGILTTLLVGKPDKPMGIHGVRRPFNPVEGEMDAFCFSDRNHLGVKLQRPLPTAKLFDAIFLAADTFLRHSRIELEWVAIALELPACLRGHRWPFRAASCRCSTMGRSRRRSRQRRDSSQFQSEEVLALEGRLANRNLTQMRVRRSDDHAYPASQDV